MQVCNELDKILYNSYHGIGSKFLKEQIKRKGGNFMQIEKAQGSEPKAKQKITQRVWAGSLHIDPKDLGKKKKKQSLNEAVFGESKKTKNKKRTQADILH